MSTDPNELLEQAMRLSPEKRAALAGSLLSSLDETHDLDAEASWAAETQRRMRELEKGRVTTIPWKTARNSIVND